MTPNNPSPPSAAATDEAAFEAARARIVRWMQTPNSVLSNATMIGGIIRHDDLATILNFAANRSSQRPSPSVGREEVVELLRIAADIEARPYVSGFPWRQIIKRFAAVLATITPTAGGRG